MVDVGGGQEIAGERFTEFDAEAFGFKELGFGACVEDAEARMLGMAKHAAAATVLKWELAEFGFVDGVAGSRGGAGCCGHWRGSLEEVISGQLSVLSDCERAGPNPGFIFEKCVASKGVTGAIFGCVAGKGLTGADCGCVANKGVSEQRAESSEPKRPIIHCGGVFSGWWATLTRHSSRSVA